MPRYRSERWSLLWGQESRSDSGAYGALPSGTTTAIYNFGAFDEATLPDPEFDHIPMWMYKSDLNRNLSKFYRGRASYSGSIPNIVLLDGRCLHLPLYDDVDHSVAPAPFTHTIPGTAPTSSLSSFRIVAAYYPDSSSTAGLTRFWRGGKVNRATIHCEEGGMLMMSLDQILFRGVSIDNNVADTLVTPYSDSDVAIGSVTLPTTEPFYFSECVATLRFIKYTNATTAVLTSEEVANISSFRIDINNNITPKYYLTDGADAASSEEHGPYELIEGRQEIRLSMQVELADFPNDGSAWLKDMIYENLLRQGRTTNTALTPDYEPIVGVGVRFVFTRAGDSGDSITINIPGGFAPSTGLNTEGALIVRAPHNIITNEGLVSVPMEMICRNMNIVISDRIEGAGVDTAGYPDQNLD